MPLIPLASSQSANGQWYRSLCDKTQESWSRARRVVTKVCYGSEGLELRHVVTSLPAAKIPPSQVYTDKYCPRGEMENRLKEQQLDLFADRTSTQTFESNQQERQKAEGRRQKELLPRARSFWRPGGSWGLSPPLKSLIQRNLFDGGLNPPSNRFPSALCLLPSAFCLSSSRSSPKRCGKSCLT